MMNSFFLKLVFYSMGLLLVTACQSHPTDYVGLMTHPEALERDFGRCQDNQTTAADCTLVRKAASDFAELVSQRAANPEAFGMKILSAELALVNSQGKASYNEQKEKVDILLAVVSATSLVGN